MFISMLFLFLLQGAYWLHATIHPVLFGFNNYIFSVFNSIYVDILWLYGESETSVMMLSGSTYTVWLFIASSVLL